METTINLDEVKRITGVHPARIWNIYLYGSQVYGNARKDSDNDILVVASNMQVHQEFKDEVLNIHVWTPDWFKEKLHSYNMVNLECIFAPSFAVLQERMDFRKDWLFRKDRMKKFILSQSHNSWTNAKMKIYDGDIVRGTKSAFHALRMLVFGAQMAKHAKIVDFSAANELWRKLDDGNFLEWDRIKEEFLPTKRLLEAELINA